jgi:CheY-like chemotaxis protein/MinD-like ATPase involved in chromosome partitioning or flagellar assembly
MAGKILIIEDDPTAMRLIEYTLQQRGYQVMTTYNGLEGIITAQKEEPDLVILDIMLPGIDGFEVCKRLHSGTQTAKIPILIISAKNQKEDINTGFRAGADDYLPKPASPTEIISRVERLLFKKSSGGQTRVVAFLNAGNLPGMTMVLVNIAAALTELGKRVILADIASAKTSAAGHEKDNGRGSGRVVLETRMPSGAAEETGFEILPSGVKIYHHEECGAADEEANSNSLSSIRQACRNNDFVLLDMAFHPAPAVASIVKYSDLKIIVSDYHLDKLAEIQHTVNMFRFLDLKLKDLAAVLVDPQGEFPDLSADRLKPYMEKNLGITLAETLSFDAKMSQLFYLDSQPIVRSNPGHKFSREIVQIAKFITGFDFSKKTSPLRDSHLPVLEKKY